MSDLLLLNGPNLNLLGSREPEVYGATRLEDIEANCIDVAEEMGHTLACYQSNAEHELIDRVQQAAYTLIAEPELASRHWEIGRTLLEEIPPQAREARLFDVVGHLNKSAIDVVCGLDMRPGLCRKVFTD